MKNPISRLAGAARGPDDLQWLRRGEGARDEPQLANRHHRPDPASYSVAAGSEDPRQKYLLHYLDVRDRSVLELGPAYGHFTFMLDKLGAQRIIGVEARAENLQVCEEIKAMYHLDSAIFVQHDIARLCSGEEPPSLELTSDVVFNAGLLYHLPDPAQALRWCHDQAPEMLLMTHYFEPAAPRYYSSRTFEPTVVEVAGTSASALSYAEGGIADPMSGMAARSTWLREDTLVALLREAGYARVDTLGRDVVGSYPHIAILASAG